jgi:murein endopeptidase
MTRIATIRRGAAAAALAAALLTPAAPAAAAARAVGSPSHGRLIGGVPLAGESPWWFTWHFADRASPNPAWRRYGTDRLIALLEQVLTAYERAHPNAPRIGVGDISPKGGGPFPPEAGSVGHQSHQNGLDADVLFPRADGCECAPDEAAEVNRALAQDLVDRFAAAGGVQYLFVGPSPHLRGPRGMVIPLRYHDTHVHVRIYRGPAAAGWAPWRPPLAASPLTGAPPVLR